MSDFVIKPQYVAAIRWNRRGSCGNGGCLDPECGCAFCGLPIGVSEDDPRWDELDLELAERKGEAKQRKPREKPDSDMSAGLLQDETV